MNPPNVDLSETAKNVLEGFVFWIILRGIIYRWISDEVRDYIFKPLQKYLMKRLVHSRRELAIWMHYQNRRRNEGHQCRLKKCDDDLCKLI